MSLNSRQHIKTVSCAECRRLKLKCDRVFPCASCRKRGCGDLCPTGSLPTRPRAVFQETERLKNKISLLTSRVHDLEGALGRLQARVSSADAHPLLSEEYLALSREPEDQEMGKDVKKKGREDDSSGDAWKQTHKVEDDDETENIRESLGTLALHSDGRSKFYGPTAGIESLFLNDFNDNEPFEDPPRSPSPAPSSNAQFGLPSWLPEEDVPITVSCANHDGYSPEFIPNCNRRSSNAASSSATPSSVSNSVWMPNWFTHPLPDEMVAQVLVCLERHLPDSSTACLLCDRYYKNAAWLHSAITRQEFVEDVFSHIYDGNHSRGSLTRTLPTSLVNPNSNTPAHVLPEKAAILFMMLAIGSILDLTVPAGHVSIVTQAETYHELACAAMGVAGVVERGSVRSVQCLMLMSYYHLLLDKPNGPQRCWALLGLNVHISQTIGLHRDSGWWNPDPEDVQRRRDTFWELFAFERLQVLTLGLSPSLSLQHIDCEFPEDRHPTTTATGEVQNSFLWKKKKWTCEVAADVIDTLLATPKRFPPYAKILALDRKIRDDLFLNGRDKFGGTEPSISSTLQEVANNLVKETTLVLLHRRYFARALNDVPRNLFGSRYGPSVLASYRSACHLVEIHRTLAATGSALPSRMWFMWNHLLGAAIVLAALATKNPWCTIAPGALTELDTTRALFEFGAKAGGARPAKALALVDRLRKRAHKAFKDMRTEGFNPGSTPDSGRSVGTASESEHIHCEDFGVLTGGRLIKEISKKHSPRSVVTHASPQLAAPFFEQQPFLKAQLDTKSSGSSPSNIFETPHPDLMADLRATNKINEANYPNVDWGFSEHAEWNNNDRDVSHAPAPDSGESNLAMGIGSTNNHGFDPFNGLDVDLGRADLGIVNGGVAWDPSWRSLMDQLGVTENQKT